VKNAKTKMTIILFTGNL